MTKKEALIILIEHSYLLDSGRREKLVSAVPTMTNEEMNALGTTLSNIKKESIDNLDNNIQKIDTVLKNRLESKEL